MAAEHESDGIHEVMDEGLRLAITVAGRMGENHARNREQQHRNAEAQSQQGARELASRLDAERNAARAERPPVHNDAWWEQARGEDIQRVWQSASAWREEDPVALNDANRIREGVRSRYGQDIEDLGADPAAVNEEIARRERERADAEGARARASRDQGQAQTLMGSANRADRAATPTEATATAEVASEVYDSSERRREYASSLQANGVEPDAVEAVILADTAQAHPARDAVAQAPANAPPARRSRGHGAARGPTRSDRGR